MVFPTGKVYFTSLSTHTRDATGVKRYTLHTELTKVWMYYTLLTLLMDVTELYLQRQSRQKFIEMKSAMWNSPENVSQTRVVLLKQNVMKSW